MTDETPDPAPDPAAASAPTGKKPARGRLAKKRSRRRERIEPYDPETDAAERAAEGLPPRVSGTMAIDQQVVLGFSYPPEDDPDTPPAQPDDDESEPVLRVGFLDEAVEWFRRAPVMGTIILVLGTAVIVIPIVLFSLDGSTEVDPSDVEIIDQPDESAPLDTGADTDSADADAPADGADHEPPATDSESADDTGDDGDSADAPIEESNTGIYVGSAMAHDPCGPQEYDVNLRFTWYGNGEAVGEQLFTRGGNAFDITEGNWQHDVAILISEAQIWVVGVGGRPRLHNAYLPDGALPQEVPDIAEMVDGMTDEEFREAFSLPAEACVPTFTDFELEHTPFPRSN